MRQHFFQEIGYVSGPMLLLQCCSIMGFGKKKDLVKTTVLILSRLKVQ